MELKQQYLLNLFFHLTSLPLLRPHSLVFVQGHVAGPTILDGLSRLGKAGGLYTERRAPEMAMLAVATEAPQRLFSLVSLPATLVKFNIGKQAADSAVQRATQ